jgi:uncharacterized Zn finger protein
MAIRTLSMSDLRAVIEPDELKKGQAILDGRAVAHLARTEDKLYAEVQGSGSTPYRVSAAFGARDQLRGRCSCPAARFRPFCKHSAALLIAWAKTPDAFAITETPREDEARSGGAGAGRSRSRKRDDAPPTPPRAAAPVPPSPTPTPTPTPRAPRPRGAPTASRSCAPAPSA